MDASSSAKATAVTDQTIAVTDQAIAVTNQAIAVTNQAIAVTNQAIAVTNQATAVTEDESPLLVRFAAGDDAAFAELVSRYQQLAYVVACRVTLREDLALDVVQEAFLRCLRHRSRFEIGRAFKPWLLQIVRHLSIDVLRSQGRIDASTSAGSALDHVETVSDPSRDTRQRELRTNVASILAALPEKYRDLLIMREMEGMAAEAIAEQMKLDYGTTRWRLHEARRLFRMAWVARFGDEVAHEV